MYAKQIKYTDYNGRERTEIFHFHLNKVELLDLDLEYEGGLVKFLEEVRESEDGKNAVKFIKKLIYRSYGEKSEDGKFFRKTDSNGEKLVDRFIETEAYVELFYELGSNTEAAIAFVNGVIPRKIAEEIQSNPGITPVV